MNTKINWKNGIRESISLLGRAMITLGLILLLFVAYQLWGTNYFAAKSQNKLRDQFEQAIKETSTSTTKPSDTNSSTTTLPPVVDAPITGSAIASIRIDKIGVNSIVVSGTDKGTLQKGPGHYTKTPLPGQFGNSAIAGHRTTYGAPFNRLDELEIGDKIVIKTLTDTFTYKVMKKPFPVKPSDVSVIEPTKDPSDPTGQKLLPTLTLTTCHPKFSAAQRLIVQAELSTDDLDKATEATQLIDKKTGRLPTNIQVNEDDDEASTANHDNILVFMATSSVTTFPLFWWFALMFAVGMLWWFVFHRFHNWKFWILGLVVFTPTLLMYFVYLERALPSNI